MLLVRNEDKITYNSPITELNKKNLVKEERNVRNKMKNDNFYFNSKMVIYFFSFKYIKLIIVYAILIKPSMICNRDTCTETL